MHLKNSSNLNTGKVLLIDNNLIKNVYLATSGLPGYQTLENLDIRGKGAIPPQNKVGINNYIVHTSPIYMPHIKGVEGNFYKIDPHEVKLENTTRGDFGCHNDANVPGSSGCIVFITAIGWSAFQVDMKNLKDKGVDTVPLLISYSSS